MLIKNLSNSTKIPFINIFACETEFKWILSFWKMSFGLKLLSWENISWTSIFWENHSGISIFGENISVDLEAQTIIVNSFIFNFAIDIYRKHCLIKGLDDVGITLEKSNLIDIYENKIKDKSWVIPDFHNIKL